MFFLGGLKTDNTVARIAVGLYPLERFQRFVKVNGSASWPVFLPTLMPFSRAMKRAALIAILLSLAGCGMELGTGVDKHAILYCAERHRAPKEGNVDRLGLIQVYLTKVSASDSPAMQQWYKDMDACVAEFEAKKQSQEKK